MKNAALILTLLASLNSLSQANWNLSDNGVPTGYSPNDFALAANGDVYLGASLYSGTAFIPKLLKSTNSGGTWTEITTTGLDSIQNVNAIIFSGNTLLLSGSNSTLGRYYVYASNDNGQTWQLSNSGIPSGYSPNDFALAANGDVYLVASEYTGTAFAPKLLKSTNGGAAWSEITMTGLTGVQNTGAIIFIGNNLLLSGSGGESYYVYISTDNGQNWQVSNSGIPSGYSVNDFTLASGQRLYAACSLWNGTTFSPKIMESVDAGASWIELTVTGLNNLQNTNAIIYSGDSLLLAGSNSTTSTYYIFSCNISTTGIKSFDVNNRYSLFPNPFDTYFHINGQSAAYTHIEVINSIGQTLFAGDITAGEKVNTSNWVAGVYFVRISVNGSLQEVIKIVK